jgi:LuxR family transcriptional regulator, quorum-sensing system regulator CciR
VAAQQALRRAAAEKRRQQQSKDKLTPREREVLTWILHGKTDYEIAVILGISQVTVLQHVENAKRKFNTGKRMTVVIEALRRAEISL